MEPIKRNDTGAAVEDVQQRLARIGHLSEDAVSGTFDDATTQALAAFCATVSLPVADEVTSRLWGQVSIDAEACRSCRMCATFCPTGALTRFEGPDGAIGLDHRPYRCVQCRLCENICMTGALTVSDTVSLADFEQGRVHRISLDAPTWTPNKPDSIFRKMNQVIGGENNSYF